MVSYGSPPTSGLGALVFQLTTSGTMIGGVLALVVTLILGASIPVAFGVAAVAGIGVFVALAVMTIRFYLRLDASTAGVAFESVGKLGATRELDAAGGDPA